MSCPQGLEIGAVFPEACEVQWTPVVNAVKYVIKVESENHYEIETSSCFLQIDNLIPDKEYEVSVCSCGEFAKSAFSSPIIITIPSKLNPLPANTESILYPPDNLCLKSHSTSGICASWNKVENAASYTVYYGEENNTSLRSINTDQTSIILNNLEEVKVYVCKVKAVQNTISSAFSNTAIGRTLLSIPKTPELLVSEAEYSIYLSWNSIPNAEEYIILMGNEETALSEYIKTKETALIVESLNSSSTYFFAVKAQNATGISDASVTKKAVTRTVIPETPKNLIVTSYSVNSIAISWEPSYGTDSYLVEYGETKSSMTNTAECTNTAFCLDTLAENSLWYFRVRAKNTAGESSNSETVSAKTPLLPPPPVTIDNIKFNNTTGPSSIIVHWIKTEKAEGYRIYRSTGDENNFVSIAESTGTQYLDTEAYAAIENTTYFYKVESYNSGGSGEFSNIEKAELRKPVLFFDVTAKTMTGYYEFYLDEELICPEIFIDVNDPRYVLCPSVDTGIKILQIRYKKTLDREWSSTIDYDPINFCMGAEVTCKCQSMTKQSIGFYYELE